MAFLTTLDDWFLNAALVLKASVRCWPPRLRLSKTNVFSHTEKHVGILLGISGEIKISDRYILQDACHAAPTSVAVNAHAIEQ